MDQEKIEKVENLVTLYNQVCLYMTVIVIFIMIRCLWKKQPKSNTGTDFIYNTDCPICFNGFTIPIKSDCGHGFCLECLYTYWKKPTWNNMCPLCRKTISNLTPMEGGTSDTWSDEILKKIKRITSKKNIYRLTFMNNRSTVYSCFFCAIFLVMWTYAVSNLKKMVYYIFSVYNALYDIKTTINIL